MKRLLVIILSVMVASVLLGCDKQEMMVQKSAQKMAKAVTNGDVDSINQMILGTDKYEYAHITAYDEAGDTVWKYQTKQCVRTELPAVVELGQRDGRYYFVEDTSVVCLDVQTGDVLWKNDDYAGRASGFAFGDAAIYLCGQYGPDFYAISYAGETLARISQFDPTYSWATEIELLDGRAAVYLHGGASDYEEPIVFYVDLSTYAVTTSPGATGSGSLVNEVEIYTQYLLSGGYSELMGYEVEEENLKVYSCLIDIDGDGIDELMIYLRDDETPVEYSAFLDIQVDGISVVAKSECSNNGYFIEWLSLLYNQDNQKHILTYSCEGYPFLESDTTYIEKVSIYSDNLQNIEWDIELRSYGSGLLLFGDKGDKIRIEDILPMIEEEIKEVRNETTLIYESAVNYYDGYVYGDVTLYMTYKINGEYVTKEECEALIERFIHPVDHRYLPYQTEPGTYYAPISGE